MSEKDALRVPVESDQGAPRAAEVQPASELNTVQQQSSNEQVSQVITSTGEGEREQLPLTVELTHALGAGAVDKAQSRQRGSFFSRFLHWNFGIIRANTTTPQGVEADQSNTDAATNGESGIVEGNESTTIPYSALENLSLSEILNTLPDSTRIALENKRQRELDGVRRSTELTALNILRKLATQSIKEEEIDDQWEVDEEYDLIDDEVQKEITAAEGEVRSRGLKERARNEIALLETELKGLRTAAKQAQEEAERQRQSLLALAAPGTELPEVTTQAQLAYLLAQAKLNSLRQDNQ